MPRTYLLSRTLDPLLGVFTGFLAYYLHETNPRTAPPPGHTLKDLVSWQMDQNKQRAEKESAASAASDSAELEAVRRELDDAQAVDKVMQASKSHYKRRAKWPPRLCRTCRLHVYYSY
ncbi:hypothetical protein CspeluHIS016_0309520 [Cutaneotrichosporon spelunceum]|uniref:Uncharacterized protein n=1 Tax=Cutaneotrichosporon spelunceum TaxID=1672016 RepID=A0AAD3YCP3_9TREE|nr:hypothetical protein CspeluHIS016_0309520 [Cutaneotrichosporon spelunceum]